MTNERHPLWTLLDQIQMNHRQLGAQIVELRAHFAQLPLPAPERTKCPICGIPAKGPRTLAEHLHNSHNGPLPDHWVEGDARAQAPARPVERAAECVARWPECEVGGFDPRCCRFPKSCSCWPAESEAAA